MEKNYKELNELAAQFKSDTVDFAQRLIKTPSLSGQEKEGADLYLDEMKKL